MNAFSEIKKQLSGSAVTVLGNGPSLALIEELPGSKVATMNAGLPFAHEKGWPVDLYWVQDRRFPLEKGRYLFPFLNLPKFVAFSAELLELRESRLENGIPVNVLGDVGFSRHPEIGVFSGYSALHGVLQILFYAEVSEIFLIGTDQFYGTRATRSYQSTRGKDVDLHVAHLQNLYILQALEICEIAGIRIHIQESSLLAQARQLD